MGRKNNCLILVSAFLLFSFIPTLNFTVSHINSGVLDPSSTSIITLTNFTGFEKYVDDPLIHSSMNNTHIDFLFNTSSLSHPLYERYQYILPVNCSDFSICLNLQYNMSSISEGLIVYFTAYGEDNNIIENGIQDAWSASQGLYYVNGWPFGVYDLHVSPTNSAGLSGNVTFQISRTNNVAVGKILDENAVNTLHSYQWTEGLETKIYRITASFRTNFDATKMQATFSGINANFTYETSDSTTPSFIFGPTSNSVILLSSVVLSFVILLCKRRKKLKTFIS